MFTKIKKFNEPWLHWVDVVLNVSIICAVIAVVATLGTVFGDSRVSYQSHTTETTTTCISKPKIVSVKVWVKNNDSQIKELSTKKKELQDLILQLDKEILELTVTNNTPIYQNMTDVENVCFDKTRCRDENWFYNFGNWECGKMPTNSKGERELMKTWSNG